MSSGARVSYNSLPSPLTFTSNIRQNAIRWIFEYTVGPIIDWVMNELHLQAFIEGFINKLKEITGIQSVEDQVKNVLESSLNTVREPLMGIAEKTGVGSIEQTVLEVSSQKTFIGM